MNVAQAVGIAGGFVAGAAMFGGSLVALDHDSSTHDKQIGLEVFGAGLLATGAAVGALALTHHGDIAQMVAFGAGAASVLPITGMLQEGIGPFGGG